MNTPTSTSAPRLRRGGFSTPMLALLAWGIGACSGNPGVLDEAASDPRSGDSVAPDGEVPALPPTATGGDAASMPAAAPQVPANPTAPAPEPTAPASPSDPGAPAPGNPMVPPTTGGSDTPPVGPMSPGGETPPDVPPMADADGCPILLEGFATLDALGQNGTTGGLGGSTVTVTTQAELNQYAAAPDPYVIRVQGAITLVPKGTEIRVASDKTIVGVGSTAEIVEGGFFLANGVHNVIIRNLTIRDTIVPEDTTGDLFDFDAIQMDTAHHVWIDHCHLLRMNDGLIDSRIDTTYLTVSWNVLSDHNKTFGIGWTANVVTEMTLHHNWMRDTNQRNPSVDNVLRAHLYNNFLQRIASYGNYARGGTNMVLENSVFEDVNDPHYADTGSLVALGNIYRGTSGLQETLGTAFFNPSDYYAYTLDPADTVEARLAQCAGPRPTLGL